MAYKKSVQTFQGKINEVVIGTGERAITIGGENVLPFHTFDGETGSSQKVGVEIIDEYPEEWIQGLKEVFGDSINDTVQWAKFVQENTEADFLCLTMQSADPNGSDRSVFDCVNTAKAVADAVTLPLVIAGCGVSSKDEELFKAVAEALEGKNVLLSSATEDNYKTVGAAGGMAYKQKVGAESSVDINLAKQLNILLNQLGVKNEDMIMNVGCAAAGYGFEYVSSTMDRIRLAALSQNDKTLQMPIITPVSTEVWSVKETVESEEASPEWGTQIDRGIGMEITTATASLISGANAVILRHPESIKTVKEYIKQMLV